MSLANKHRPQTFDTVVGQDHITDILKAQIKSDTKKSHNYIFFGPRGTGKTTDARILAKALNCLNLQDGNPCNQCANCEVINKGTTLDYIEIDAASHTGVDNIREEILDKVPYPPTQLKKKIYVIDEVHMLSKGAFNALLKTIEEPKDNVCFVLATTEVHKIPDTIISRCQVFNFKKIPVYKMTQHLKNICDKEELKYGEEALNVISRISEGCVRDAVKYVDQVSILGDINEEHITQFLGVASEAAIEDMMNKIKAGNREEIFTQVDALHEQGVDLHQFAKQVLMYIDHNLHQDTDFLLRVSEIFTEIISTIRYYPYPAVVYKVALNKYLNPAKEDPIAAAPKTVNEPKPTVSETVDTSAPTPVVEKKEEPKVETTAPIKTSSQETEPAANSPAIWWEHGDLLGKLLAKVDKPSLKTQLTSQIVIDDIVEDHVKIIVINSMTKMLLDKQENLEYIEWLFTEILEKPIKIELTFEKKEDYFARKLME